MVLGTAQDGGYPHIGCRKKCCQPAWIDLNKKRFIASLSIIDRQSEKCWIIDMSPDIKSQLNMIMDFLKIDNIPKIEGIFLTHAHIGHYSGLLELGKEALNTHNIPLYVMPEMENFIKTNNPFKFLISSKNVSINSIEENKEISLTSTISINPFLVPHRNELSETVGYQIFSNDKKIIYLPDIDSWDEWDQNILNLIENNDILLLDGTFYDKDEIDNRNISEIPHPSICESLNFFSGLNRDNRNKIFFTHLNHTNTAIKEGHESRRFLNSEGYHIANDGQVFYI